MSNSIFLGVDLGHHSIVTASSRFDEPFNVQVDANALSNRSTPALIGLENNRILYGEEAETRLGSVPHKIASVANATGPRLFDEITLESAHLFSLFFRLYLDQVHGGEDLSFVTLAVPLSFGSTQIKTLVEAALLAGLRSDQFDIIDHMDAAFTTLINKEAGVGGVFGGVARGAVIVVDVGFAHTSIGVWAPGCASPQKSSVPEFGVSTLVNILGDILTNSTNCLQNLKSVDDRFYFRFFKVCEKALKELSMLPTAVVDLGDFEDSFDKHAKLLSKKLSFNKPRIVERAEFEDKIAGFLAKVENAIADSLTGLPERTRVTVEVVGGGSRVPSVALSIAKACGVEKVGRGLDGSSFAAVGAGLWSAGKRGWDNASRVTPELIASCVENASRLHDVQKIVEFAHTQEVLKLERKNALESFVYKIRHLLDSGVDGIDVPVVREALDTVWDWFNKVEDGEETVDVEGSEFLENLTKLDTIFQTGASTYLEKLETDKAKMERSLTANAEYLKSHSANESAASKREKHGKAATTTNEQEIKLAGKNRDEGNELFKHGTPTDAMNRYMRSLNIIAKLVRSSLTKDECELVDSVALACNLNMVQCVIRLTGAQTGSALKQEERHGLLKRGIACADSAIAIDPRNSKAKYRKAVCLDRMKETEEAKKVLDEALIQDPENDDLKRLFSSIKATLKEQESKAKKFFGKMFQ